MTEADLQVELTRLTDLCRSVPVIKRIWVFGSRHKKTHGPDSDLDIAIEVEWVSGELLGVCEDWFALWSAALPKFEKSFISGCPWPMDIQCYADAQSTPKIHEYLQEASNLIYEKP
tara:strand:- start:98 stop:445 length:348 start_codon:yes stop_codon:yes gene_type:complete